MAFHGTFVPKFGAADVRQPGELVATAPKANAKVRANLEGRANLESRANLGRAEDVEADGALVLFARGLEELPP